MKATKQTEHLVAAFCAANKSSMRTSPEMDKRILADVLSAYKRPTTSKPTAAATNIGRIIMQSPLTKLAVAAAVIIACVIGLSLWKTTGSGIALADVLIEVQQATAYMYQMTMTISGKSPGPGTPINQTVEASVVSTQDGNMKMTMNTVDRNSGKILRNETFMLPREKAVISIMPEQRMYMRVDLDDTLIERTRQQNNDPGAMLERILKCKYERLGRSRIDGVEVEGFRTTDPNYLGGVTGAVDVKIWVDVKTQLLVRSEGDVDAGGMKTHGVVSNFQWDYAVDAATFKPVIPADYTSMSTGPIKMPTASEEAAIHGLAIFADRTGRYPDRLDLTTLMGLLTKVSDSNDPSLGKDNATLKKLLESGASNEEAIKETTKDTTNKTVDTMLSVRDTIAFYISLRKDKKDPVYYGNVVTPKDTDKVLLRWKLSDSDYRVIFGDLHAETVSPERLAELEKGLSK
jgi:hypothetical protein